MENILLGDVVHQSPLKRKKLSNDNNEIYIVRENSYEPPHISNNNNNYDTTRALNSNSSNHLNSNNNGNNGTSNNNRLTEDQESNILSEVVVDSNIQTTSQTPNTNTNHNSNNKINNNNNNNNNNEPPSSPISFNEVENNNIEEGPTAHPPPIVVNSVVLYTIKDITNRLSKDFKELANCMLHCCPLLYEHSAVKNAQIIVEKLNNTIMASLEGLHKNQQPPQQQHYNHQYQLQPSSPQIQTQPQSFGQYPTSPPIQQQQQQQQQNPLQPISLQHIHHYNQAQHQAQYQQLSTGIPPQQNNTNNPSTTGNLGGNNTGSTTTGELQHPSFQALLQSIYQPIVQQQQLLQQKINEQPQSFIQAYQAQLQQQQPHLKYYNPYIIPSPMIPNHNQHINVNNLINNPIIYKPTIQQPPLEQPNNTTSHYGDGSLQSLHQQQIQQQLQQQQQIQQYNQHIVQQQQQLLQHDQQAQMSKSLLLNNLVNSLSQSASIDFTRASLSDYQLLDQLGTGSFAKVRLCKHFDTGRLFCMKILNQNKIIRLRQEIHVCNEKEVLLEIENPFIVKLFATYKDSRYLYFLQEFIPCGELFDYIRRHGSLSQRVTQLCAAEIVLALEYLHSLDIIYRDLKPENVLIDHQGHIKLTDFGFAKKIKENTKSMCGTPEYIAPEILSGHGHGKSADWWSLGILIYEMLVGVPPFINNEGSTHDIFKLILAGKIIIPSDIDPVSRDIIEKLVVVDVEKRLGSMEGGIEDIKNHPFFLNIDWSKIQLKQLPPLEPILKPIKHYPTMDDDDDDDDQLPPQFNREIVEQRKREFFGNF